MKNEEILNHPACRHCKPVIFVNGERWQQYIIDYWFQGKYWPLDIYARSWQEAEARAKALQHAKVVGATSASIPVTQNTAPLVRPFMDFVSRGGHLGSPVPHRAAQALHQQDALLTAVDWTYEHRPYRGRGQGAAGSTAPCSHTRR